MDNLTQNIFQSWLVSTTFQIIVLSALAYIAYHSFKKSRNSKYKISDSKLLAFNHFLIAILFVMFLHFIAWIWGPFLSLSDPLASYVLDLIRLSNNVCDASSGCAIYWLNALMYPILLSGSLILTSIVYLFEKNILNKFKKNKNLWNYTFIVSSALFITVTSYLFVYNNWY